MRRSIPHPPSASASPLRGSASRYGTASSVFAAAAKAGLSQAKLHNERARMAAEHGAAGPYGPRLTPHRAGSYYPRRCNFAEA